MLVVSSHRRMVTRGALEFFVLALTTLAKKKTIEVYDFKSGSNWSRSGPVRAFNDFNLNYGRLSYAIARSILGRRVQDSKLRLEVLSALSALYATIDDQPTNLRVAPSYWSCLKDFEKSSRAGEIGQGMAYLYSWDRLGFKHIVDFKTWFKTGNPRDRLPDFVLGKRSRPGVDVMEAKGTAGSGVKGHLKEALSQCTSGKRYLRRTGGPYNTIGSSHGILTSLSKTGSKMNTRLFHVDPPDWDDIIPVDYDALSRLHYASFFALLGDYESSALLSRREVLKGIPEGFQQGDYRVLSEAQFEAPQRIVGGQIRMGITSVRLAIHNVVVGFLLGRSSLGEVSEFESKSEGTAEYFPDGTAFFVSQQ